MIIYIYTYCSCMFYVHTYLHVYIHILSMYLQYVVSIYISIPDCTDTYSPSMYDIPYKVTALQLHWNDG